MKNIKMGFLCLALSTIASHALANAGPYEPINKDRSGPTASVPESSSLALIVAGIVGIVIARRFTK